MSATSAAPFVLAIAVVATVIAPLTTASTRDPDGEKVPLKITGGDATEPRDHGRPVALVAGALKVAPDVFRSAFRQVKPAPAGTEPDPAQVRRNKSVLMAALSRYGVTNDELDRVSNFYRYIPGNGRKWPTKAAAGYAVIKDGTVASVVITDPGYGYNSLPNVAVPGHANVNLEVRLAFDNDLKKNGSVAAITPTNGRRKARVEPGRVLPEGAAARLHLTTMQKREIAELERDVDERLAKILTAEQHKLIERD
jgi:hypothetical protein